MKIILLGDIHLGKLKTYFSNEDDYVYQQLDVILNYARDKGIKKVVQLGDVFDHPSPDQKCVRRFIEYLYVNRDLHWEIILGNHDFGSTKSHSLEVSDFLTDQKILPNVNIYTKATHKTEQGINFFYAPWPAHKKFDYLQSKSCVCFGHLEITGSVTDSGQEIKHGLSRDDLDPKDFWLMGHLHRKQDFHRIHYPGTAVQYSFGEPLPKGFSVVDIDESSIDSDQLNISIKHIKIETPYELKNIKIKQQEDFALVEVNNPNVLYKIFLEERGLVVPKKFVDGSVKNIFKIVNNVPRDSLVVNKEIGQEESLNVGTAIEKNIDDFSLSEEFVNSNKEMFFEPLEGIEEFLQKQELTQEQVKIALDLINSYKNEYVSRR